MKTGAGLNQATKVKQAMSPEVQYWPVLVGWIIVVSAALFGWKRQAAFAAAGMAIVTYIVVSVGQGWT